MSNPYFDDPRDQPSRFRDPDDDRNQSSPYRRPASRPAPKKKKTAKRKQTAFPAEMGPFASREAADAGRRAQIAKRPKRPVIDPNSPVQRISRMGVDPRSPQGEGILDLLTLPGIDPNDPIVQQQIGELVEEYQSDLIGPMARNTERPGDIGPVFARGGNLYGYKTGDAFGELDKLNTEDMARVQARLVGLGLLENYIPGRKDGDTQKAMGWLLQMSNASGWDWKRELNSLERIQAEDPEAWKDRMGMGGGEDDGPAPFVRDSYLAPDYATLAQTVKSQMRESLGRDPDEAEMALLTAELSGWDREAFDVEQAVAEQQYNAQVSAQEDGTAGLTGGEGQAVDPVARFKESFESRFRGALAFNQDREQTEGEQELTRGAVSTLSQMSGGMG